jgi:hypothetical protein
LASQWKNLTTWHSAASHSIHHAAVSAEKNPALNAFFPAEGCRAYIEQEEAGGNVELETIMCCRKRPIPSAAVQGYADAGEASGKDIRSCVLLCLSSAVCPRMTLQATMTITEHTRKQLTKRLVSSRLIGKMYGE